MEEFVDFITLDIFDSSTVPKYKQIANSITAKVEKGLIRPGQKLPSINQLSTYYLLSRDTVEKAYSDLKSRKIIISTPGLGYYVSSSLPESKLKVLLLFNKLSAYKKEIYNRIAEDLKDKASLSLFVYHCDFSLFKQIILENLEGYHYYVIMPHFSEYEPNVLGKILDKIPEEKLIVIDNLMPGIEHYFGCVYQNFLEDIYNTLEEAKDKLEKYKKFNLVFPDNNNYPYPKEIVQGFTKFCLFNSYDYKIISSVGEDLKISKGDVFILISETDLSNLIKKARLANLEPGKDIGVVSYNDTVLKEVLADGITVMSTDFQKMGAVVAKIIANTQPIKHKNDFNLILRKSL